MFVSSIGRSVLWVLKVKGRESQQKCSFSFSRMLDMGGMPSASNDRLPLRTVDASKNSKLRAVAFDFDILTRSLEAAKQEELAPPKSQKTVPSVPAVQPDLDQIQQVASLLKVSVDIGNETITKPSKKEIPKTHFGEDIRSKYASKLKGGLSGVELAKYQVEDMSKSGDAAGHLAAREMAIKKTAASPTKWMALTGTGRLLSYLTFRSIRIALLPNPKLKDPERQQTEFKYMKDFSTQLKEIVVDAVVPFDQTHDIEKMLREHVLDELDIHPNKVLLVSDKDEYLKAAKDLGMITCRLRPKNAKRGNVTAHYNTSDVSSVQEVVNEITGISFNAVLNR